ncbi:MAG: DNA primase [Nitriliruptorales bacterium]|nr:DNA primase [Nitriliruptorales bacterium]
MAGRIVREDIERLRETARLVDIAGDYTRMQPAGGRWKGRCPFHDEKTPSFTVEPSRNLYHCFGCGKGGDIFDFLQSIEGIDFVEAVEHLARRMGVTLRYEQLSAGQQRALGQRTTLVQVNTAAMEFFRERLMADEGIPARDYLKQRGFGRNEADRFGLGWAPNEWDELAKALSERFDRSDLQRAGLVAPNNRGGLRDEFRGRLMFPIRDASGDVIGFGGRVVPGVDYGDFDPPKYKNSRETPLYHKTRVLFGLHEARANIVRDGLALVCEGYTDVMALHQADVGHAVATCGTAVGSRHLQLLSRYAQRVVLAFDADPAGVRAAERAWDEAHKLGEDVALDLRVLVLPDGRDPADVVAEHGGEALRARLDDAVPVVPFVLRHRLAEHDATTPEGRDAALKAALEVLGREPTPELRREYASREIADPLGLSFEFVAKSAARAGIEIDQNQGVVRPARAGRDRRREVGVGADRARLERRVLRVALQRPDVLGDIWTEVVPDDFTHPTGRAVFESLAAAGGAGTALDVILEAAPDDDVRAVIREVALEDDDLLGHDDDAVVRRFADDIVRGLLLPRARDAVREATEELARLNPDADGFMAAQQRVKELSHQLQELQPARD